MTPKGIEHIDPAERKNCTIIYLDIDLETRKKRLLERGDMNDKIDRRIEADEKDFKNFTDFDLIINNPNF
jgi:guanylate kinase